MKNRFENSASGEPFPEISKKEGVGRRTLIKGLGFAAVSLKMAHGQEAGKLSPEVQERKEKLKAYLDGLISRGYHPRFAPELLIREMPKPKEKKDDFLFESPEQRFARSIVIYAHILQEMDGVQRSTVFAGGSLPLPEKNTVDFLEKEYPRAQIIDPKIYAKGGELSVPIFFFESLAVPGKPGRVVFRIVSEISGKILFEKEYGMPKNGKIEDDKDIKDAVLIFEDLRNAYQQLGESGALQAEMKGLESSAELAPRHRSPSLVAPVEREAPQKIQGTVETFWGSWENIQIGFSGKLNSGKKLEGENQKVPSIFFIANRDLKPLREAISISGTIRYIVFDKPIMIQGKETPGGVRLRDRFGNYLEVEVLDYDKILKEKGENRKASFQITVRIKLPLAKGKIPSFRPVQVDLSALGIPEIPPAIFIPEIPQVGKEGAYSLYSEFPRDIIHHKSEIRRIATGIREAEVLFGLSPGESVNNIYISPKVSGGASINKRFQETVQVGIAFMDTWRKARPGTFDYVAEAVETGKHETFHSLSATFSIVNEGFQKFFMELPAEFLKLLSEGSFLPMRHETSGHADENAEEFFASFMLILSTPLTPHIMRARKGLVVKQVREEKGKKTVAEHDFKKLFLECIDKIESRLKEIRRIEKDAPVFALLNQRRKELTSIA